MWSDQVQGGVALEPDSPNAVRLDWNGAPKARLTPDAFWVSNRPGRYVSASDVVVTGSARHIADAAGAVVRKGVWRHVFVLPGGKFESCSLIMVVRSVAPHARRAGVWGAAWQPAARA